MIVGVGIDMIEVGRVDEKIAMSEGFREKIFSANEIAWCDSKGKNKAQHYAARFAAKEAFLKATGSGLLLGYDLHQIEVIVDDAGKPSLKLHGTFEAKANEQQWTNFHVSLSHLETMAIAVVVIESSRL